MRQVIAIGIMVSFLAVSISQSCTYRPIQGSKCLTKEVITEETTGILPYVSSYSSEPEIEMTSKSGCGRCEAPAAEIVAVDPGIISAFRHCCCCESLIFALTPVLAGNSSPEPDLQANLTRNSVIITLELKTLNLSSYSLPQGIHRMISSTVLIC